MDGNMEAKLKVMARYLITVLALTLSVTVLVAVADLHDWRLLLAVVAGMVGGDPLFKLTNRIKALSDDSVQS